MNKNQAYLLLFQQEIKRNKDIDLIKGLQWMFSLSIRYYHYFDFDFLILVNLILVAAIVLVPSKRRKSIHMISRQMLLMSLTLLFIIMCESYHFMILVFAPILYYINFRQHSQRYLPYQRQNADFLLKHFNFLEQFQIHSKIEGEVQKCPIYSRPLHIYNFSH